MRCILAGTVGVALGFGTVHSVAQEPGWRPAAVAPYSTAPVNPGLRAPAVTLGPPTVALGAPRALPESAPAAQGIVPAGWVARGKIDDKSPMPPGPALPGNQATPLPPPTPLAPAVPAPEFPFPGAPVVGGPVMSGPVTSGPIMGMPGLPGAPCPTCGPAGFDAGLPPLPGGVFTPDVHPAGPMIYANLEYLLWWIRDARLPPLLTTGTPASLGVLGMGGMTLFGDDSIAGQERSGFRLRAGWWFTPCQNWGLDGSYFFLGQRGHDFFAADAGTGVLARPFIQALTGMETSEIIALPNFSSGTFSASTSNELWGADLNLRKNVWLGCRWRLDALAGFRYLHFGENLRMAESFMGLPGGPIAGLSGMVMDNFQTRNDFYGGQLGLVGELRRGRWTFDIRTTVALGDTHQNIEISGAQMAATPGGMVMTPGLLAQATNSGQFSRDKFAVVPEVGFNVGWQATDHLKLYVGYNFLYWSRVARAGDQVDRVLNVNENAFPIMQRPGFPFRPTVPFKDTDFWAQGINFGLQLTW